MAVLGDIVAYSYKINFGSNPLIIIKTVLYFSFLQSYWVAQSWITSSNAEFIDIYFLNSGGLTLITTDFFFIQIHCVIFCHKIFADELLLLRKRVQPAPVFETSAKVGVTALWKTWLETRWSPNNSMKSHQFRQHYFVFVVPVP